MTPMPWKSMVKGARSLLGQLQITTHRPDVSTARVSADGAKQEMHVSPQCPV